MKWLIATLATLAALAALPALAQDADTRWVYKTIRQQKWECDWSGCDWRVHYRRYREPTRVYAYQRRVDDNYDARSRAHCVTNTVDVLSTEHQSEDHARDAARKLWMAKVQWHWGGVYMDLEQASEVKWRCGPSNAHDTFSGRIAETAGKLVGRDGQNMRCSLIATPCRAHQDRERDERRDRR